MFKSVIIPIWIKDFLVEVGKIPFEETGWLPISIITGPGWLLEQLGEIEILIQHFWHESWFFFLTSSPGAAAAAGSTGHTLGACKHTTATVSPVITEGKWEEGWGINLKENSKCLSRHAISAYFLGNWVVSAQYYWVISSSLGLKTSYIICMPSEKWKWRPFIHMLLIISKQEQWSIKPNDGSF